MFSIFQKNILSPFYDVNISEKLNKIIDAFFRFQWLLYNIDIFTNRNILYYMSGIKTNKTVFECVLQDKIFNFIIHSSKVKFNYLEQ